MEGGKFVGKTEAEKIVLSYILKNTPKSYSKFNPIRLETKGIAKSTGLDLRDVEEALEELSKGSARIEQVDAGFYFWLPLTGEGNKIKEEASKRNIVSTNLFLFCFITIVGIAYLFSYLHSLNYIPTLTNLTNLDFFYWGAIFTGLSIYIWKRVFGKLYLFNEKIKKIKYSKIYIWAFIILTGIIVYLWNKGIETSPIANKITFYSTIVVNIITFVVFIIQFLKKSKK